MAPDLLLTELVDAMWKKAQRGQLSASDAEAIVDGFRSTQPVVLVSPETLVPGALLLALRHGCTVCDAPYVALAVATGARPITSDARLVHRFDGMSLAPLLALLGAQPGQG